MRHLKSGKKLSRTAAHRRSLFRNMVTSLLLHERLVTTEAKAKELKSIADKMITLGKKGDLHSRRQAVSYIMNNEVVKKLFTVLADRYKAREGGYTRVLKLDQRPGDAAPMAIIEMVDRPVVEKKEKKAKAPKAPKAEKAESASAKASADKGEKAEKPAAPKKEKGEKAEKAEKKPAAPKKEKAEKGEKKPAAKKPAKKKEG